MVNILLIIVFNNVHDIIRKASNKEIRMVNNLSQRNS